MEEDKINYAALAHCADWVLRTPEERFDMATWSCGMTACAGGNMAARGLYGLELIAIQSIPHYFAFHTRSERINFGAMQEAFGITECAAEYLFSPQSYAEKTRRRVAERIRQFIGSRGYDWQAAQAMG